MQCFKCGANLKDNALVCNKCGFIMKGARTLATDEIAEPKENVVAAAAATNIVSSTQPIKEGHCYKCGTKLKEKAKLCHKCGFVMKGARVVSDEEMEAMQQQAVAVKPAAVTGSAAAIVSERDEFESKKLVKIGKAWAAWTLVFGIAACVLLIIPGINIIAAAALFVLSFIGFSNAKGQNGGLALAGIILTVVAICGSWFYNANYAEKIGTALGFIQQEQTEEQGNVSEDTGSGSSDIDFFGEANNGSDIDFNISFNTDASTDTTEQPADETVA